MRTIITTIVLAITMLYTGQAQNNNEINGEWVSGDTGRNSYAYTDGKTIEGGSFDVDLTLITEFEGEGLIYFRIDGESTYSHDTSENDRNFVNVNIIVDNGSKKEYHGWITDDGYVTIKRLEEGPNLFDLIDEMEKGNTVYIQTKGSGAAKVFKFDLNGFTKSVKRAFDLYYAQKSDNPFEKSNDNPFKG